MSHTPYPFPKHSIREQNGQYKIHVSLRKHWEKIQALSTEERFLLLLQLAKEKPLVAMAYIHKFAKRGDPLAQQVARAYAGYQQFLAAQDPTLISELIKDPDVRSLIDTLIPGFDKTLAAPRVVLADPEQIIRVSEMSCAYNAFPDLIHYQGSYYLSFREAGKHQGKRDLGKVRILKGKYQDKKWSWENAALLESEIYDLRDPKFYVDGKGVLRLMIGGSVIGKKGTKKMVPHVGSLIDGQWSLEQATLSPETPPLGQWLWQVSWNQKENAGYGFAYGINDYKTLYLMKTLDSSHFEKIAQISDEDKKLNLTETTIRFKEEGSALALIRADSKTIIGKSSPDYTEWQLTKTAFHGGGQNFVFMGDQAVVTTRHIFLNSDNVVEERMLIGLIEDDQIIPVKTLPSQFDTGYAGIVVEDDKTLTVAYYSCKTIDSSDIYVVTVTFE